VQGIHAHTAQGPAPHLLRGLSNVCLCPGHTLNNERLVVVVVLLAQFLNVQAKGAEGRQVVLAKAAVVVGSAASSIKRERAELVEGLDSTPQQHALQGPEMCVAAVSTSMLPGPRPSKERAVGGALEATTTPVLQICLTCGVMSQRN